MKGVPREGRVFRYPLTWDILYNFLLFLPSLAISIWGEPKCLILLWLPLYLFALHFYPEIAVDEKGIWVAYFWSFRLFPWDSLRECKEIILEPSFLAIVGRRRTWLSFSQRNWLYFLIGHLEWLNWYIYRRLLLGEKRKPFSSAFSILEEIRDYAFLQGIIVGRGKEGAFKPCIPQRFLVSLFFICGIICIALIT